VNPSIADVRCQRRRSLAGNFTVGCQNPVGENWNQSGPNITLPKLVWTPIFRLGYIILELAKAGGRKLNTVNEVAQE
jgi:hypothetical protein